MNHNGYDVLQETGYKQIALSYSNKAENQHGDPLASQPLIESV